MRLSTMPFKIMFLLLFFNNFQQSSAAPATGEECFSLSFLQHYIPFPFNYLTQYNSLIELYEKEKISEGANAEADRLANAILYNSNFLYDYGEDTKYEEDLDQKKRMWLEDLVYLSQNVLHILDEVNIFVNLGNTTKYEPTILHPLFYYYLFYGQELLKSFVYEQIPYYQEMARQHPFIKQRILKEASCLYNKLELVGLDNADISDLIEKLPEEELLNYVEKMYEVTVNSPRTEQFVQRLYELIQNKSWPRWVNEGFAEMYSLLITIRSVLLKTDFEVLVKIDHVFIMLDKAENDLLDGQWPEMEKFMDNLYRLTLGKPDFWIKSDKLYQSNQRMIRWMENKIIKFFKNILVRANGISEGNSSHIIRVFDDYLDRAVNNFGNFLFFAISYTKFSLLDARDKCNVFWYAKGWTMDYGTFKDEISKIDEVYVLTDLLFSNWPKEEIFPHSLDMFLEEIFQEINPCKLLVTGDDF